MDQDMNNYAAPPVWEFCEVGWKIVRTGQDAFTATINGPNGPSFVVAPDSFKHDLMNMGNNMFVPKQNPAAVAALTAFTNALLADNWEMVMQQHPFWYSRQFRRVAGVAGAVSYVGAPTAAPAPAYPQQYSPAYPPYPAYPQQGAAPPRGMSTPLKVILIVVGILVVLGVIGATYRPNGSSSISSSSNSSAPAPARVPAEAPITQSGSGIMKTSKFHLNGGDYTIDWTARDTNGTVGCYHGGFLHGSSVGDSEMIVNEQVDAGKTKSGQTHAYGLDPGEYYLDMSSGCDWTVTIRK